MKRLLIVLAFLLVLGGCKYFTIPLTNVSGPETTITKKERVEKVKLDKQRRIVVKIRPVRRSAK